jgi:NAD(P)-dependent dehydrogenase (short-subunit alcohol dehydrogenase family)
MLREKPSTEARTPVVLVTGVSSGIGLALARRLWADPRFRVIATARSGSLARVTGVSENERFRLRPLDVTDARERSAVIVEAERDWGGVDILVNNAGFAYRSVFEHMTEEDLKRQLATNFVGPMELMRLVLPGMRRRRSGRIINVSSVSGMMAMPTMSSYTASKFALEGATEAVWSEMKPWNVHVTLVQPGFIRSDSFSNVAFSEKARASIVSPGEPYHRYYEEMTPFIARMMARAWATPDSVAGVILKTMLRAHPPLRVAATFDARLFGWLRRVLPRAFYHELLYRCLPGISRWRNQ